jgi:hypothetical protein
VLITLLVDLKVFLFMNKIKNDSSDIEEREISNFVVFLYLILGVVC